MIRLRFLQVAALLLLLQISSVEGLLNLTGWKSNKACWVSEQCFKGISKQKTPEKFIIIKEEEQYNKLIQIQNECTKYFIVTPGTEDFGFEFMHDGIDKDKPATIGFNGHKKGMTFTCHKQQVVAGSAAEGNLVVIPNPSAEQRYFYCRFTVKEKIRNEHETFWDTFTYQFKALEATIKTEGMPDIEIAEYNVAQFTGRVPCDSKVWMDKGPNNDEYLAEPLLDVTIQEYTCPSNYTMNHKMFTDAEHKYPEKEFHKSIVIKCEWGTVQLGPKKKVASAKCYRLRSSLCQEVMCPGCTGNRTVIINPDNGDQKRTIHCNTNFMIINDNIFTRHAASCYDKSTPDDQKWTIKENKTPIPISSVKCVDTLDCNDLVPPVDAVCDTCSKANSSKGRLTCTNGGTLKFFDENNKQYPATFKCNQNKGEWEVKYAGKLINIGHEKSKTMKVGCVGPQPKTTTEKPQAAAQAGQTLLIVGCSLGVLILLLLILLLIYWLCCRKKNEKPKEESKKTPTPKTETKTETKTDSSAVEVELLTALPLQPVSNESDGPGYSGKRVEFINVSKERLREIEPTLPEEFSAKDLTDSARSKVSQISQVGGTTDGGITFTGTRVTEQTNEVSRTVIPDDPSRSDASNGGNDQSQTGGGGKTPTIGEAAAKKKTEKEKKGGAPRVAFRERVSHESDTKTRDQSSMAGMVTAPEQLTQQTQPEGGTVEGKKKDDPSRLTAEKARKTFGKERTRTTQNTKEANEEANPSQQQESVVAKRSTSRVTDNSRTG